jgi:hypothetical protein
MAQIPNAGKDNSGQEIVSTHTKPFGSHLLLLVICRVGKEAGVKPPLDTIAACNDNPMLPRLDKFIVQ